MLRTLSPARLAVAALAVAVPVVLAFLLASCSAPARTSPNIVLVVLDTVRDDFAGESVPGRPGEPLTPSLDRLANEGTSFTSAWSNAPWTVPSHASIFTGEFPSTHGCTGHNWRFSYSGATMAERLHEAGYRTMAFFSNPWLTDELTGVLRGFDEQYVDPRILGRAFSAPDQGGGETVDVIERWLDRTRDDEPFLMFVNILEAHLPYAPTGTYRERYLPDVAPWESVRSAFADSVNTGLKDLEDADWDRVRRMYAGDVAHSDSLLGAVVAALKAHDRYDDTVVIVTSDHGELLGEHGFLEHQFGVYEELLDVPLVIRAPGLLEPGLRDDPVMLSDLYDTVLDLAGLEPDGDSVRSRSLLGPPALQNRPLLAEYAGPSLPLRRKLHAVAPDLKASYLTTAYVTLRVDDLRLTLGSDGSSTLEDVEGAPPPPAELSRRREDLMATLRSLKPRPGRRTAAGEVRTDRHLEERLRSLGYIN